MCDVVYLISENYLKLLRSKTPFVLVFQTPENFYELVQTTSPNSVVRFLKENEITQN